MKRNENIVLLSKDHHFGLLCSWKIRQGLKKEVDLLRIKNYIQYFWESHLKEHFRQEEQTLFHHLQDEYAQKIKKDHSEIETLISQIHSSETPNIFNKLADALEQHIRFEERIWFPHLEKNLNTETLEKVGKELYKIHSEEKDNHKDEFWK